jgi:hypothetical protein
VLAHNDEPVWLEVFADTGSSGSVISHLHNTDEYGLPWLHLEGLPPHGDFVGVYTETGIGAEELGDVTKPFEVRVANIVPGMAGSLHVSDAESYGDLMLWVRRDAGPGEAVEISVPPFGSITLTDPINIVGMPVISQRVLVLDVTPMAAGQRLDTKLLPAGDENIPVTQAAVDVEMRSFVPEEAPPGEILPSSADNPVLPNVRIVYDPGGGPVVHTAGDWLFDTGAASTMVDFSHMQAVGAIDSGVASFEAFMADYEGPTSTIGGIGEQTLTVPILTLDEIRLTDTEGRDLVWKNVEVLMVDNVAGLDGIFGMNLLVPSVTLDLTALGLDELDLGELGSGQDLEDLFGDYAALLGILAQLEDQSPGFFHTIVFDATDPDDAQLRFGSSYIPEPAAALLLAAGTAALLRRRRRRAN